MLWNTFRRWLIGDMGTPGDYMYQPIHLITLAVVIAVFVLICVLGLLLRKDSQKLRKLLVCVSVFQLAFEIGWRLIYWLVKGDSLLCWWPMYPCNLGGILLPIFALANCRRGKQMFYLFGFVGGVLTFAMPDGIFSSDVMVFPIVKSILQHTGLLMIPALELIGGTYRPTLKDLCWVIIGCLIHLLNCEVLNPLLGFNGDYMFLRSGLPFVIPGVPQFITISVFALFVLALLSFLCNPQDSLHFLKGFRRQKVC